MVFLTASEIEIMIVTFALVWIITILYSPQEKYNILNLQLKVVVLVTAGLPHHYSLAAIRSQP